jgi:putative ABC transport system ATP-binding protein
VTIVDAVSVSKVYQDGAVQVPAVKEATLSVTAGEVVAVLGPSGSGKTTLLSMLGCILRVSTGQIRVCGERVEHLDEAQLPLVRRRYIGFIFQSFNLFTALTAAENVEILLNMKGIVGRAARREALRLLESVGLAPRARALPRMLSGGEKQRVSVARALAGDPPLILADEPTANLDARNGEQVMKLLRDCAKSAERAVIVVTHDHRVMPYIDRVVRLEDGTLTGDSETAGAAPLGAVHS